MALDKLWDSFDYDKVISPKQMVEDAVEKFNEMTLKLKKDVYFRIHDNKQCADGLRRLGLYLVAPELNGYSSLVLTVEYPLSQIYPCQICDWLSSQKPDSSFICDCETAEDFESELADLLSDPVMQNTISSMISQCSAMTKDFHGLPRENGADSKKSEK